MMRYSRAATCLIPPCSTPCTQTDPPSVLQTRGRMGRTTTAIMHVAYIFIIFAVRHCHALSAASTAAAVPAGLAQAAAAAAAAAAASPSAAAAAVSAKASSSNKLPPPAAAAAPRWLSTRGRHIIDAATGERFKLRCGSWSGAQEAHYVPNGLWAQPRSVIAQQAAALGLNCIRFVWSVEAVLGRNSGQQAATVPAEALIANPDLVGRTPLEVWDAVIRAIADAGMVVILDNHSSDAMWCCGIQDGNGLWYTERWSEQQWLDAWGIVAKRYANIRAVVGMGLRNEPRPTLTGGFKVPAWGTGDALDIAVAYEKAAAAVLAHRPTYLVAAQGLLAGRDLRAVSKRPLVMRTKWPDGPIVKNQLVYEAHEYPFLWGNFPFEDYKRYSAALDENWGFISNSNMAPIWVGEFGVEHTHQGLSSPWFQAISRYIRERDLDWAWWQIDGQQGPSRTPKDTETYGLLNTTWNGPVFLPLVAHLKSLG